jgi:branched-chain amino acid transport system permease protein
VESLVKFAKQRRGLAAAVVVVAIFALMYVTDAKQLAPMFSNVGTGALISAIALGVVLTYRGSGVVNFANGVVTIFIA